MENYDKTLSSNELFTHDFVVNTKPETNLHIVGNAPDSEPEKVFSKQNEKQPEIFVPASPVVFLPTATNYQPANYHSSFCSHCKSRIDTEENDVYSNCTYIWACLLFWLTPPFLTCLPFLMDDLKKRVIKCKTCKKTINSYRKTSSKTYAILSVVLVLGLTLSVVAVVFLLKDSKWFHDKLF